MSLELGRLEKLVNARDIFGICSWVDDVVASVRNRRTERQTAVYRWVVETFGEPNANVKERVLRLVEEVVELAQAEGVHDAELRALVTHVYGKPVGEPSQEVGGIGTTLLAYCAAKGISADAEEERELERVLLIDPEYFRKRHNLKAEAGITRFVPEPPKR